MLNRKVTVLLSYANPHVTGWVLELKKYCEVIIGVQHSVNEFRDGYFTEQDEIPDVFYFFKPNHKREFLKKIQNADVLITLGLFDLELIKISKKLKRKCVTYVMSEPFNPTNSSKQEIKRKLYVSIFRFFYGNVNFLCMGGVEVKRYYQQLGFKKSNYYDFGYFPKLELLQLERKYALRYDRISFLFVGQLIKRKGILNLLNAIKELAQKSNLSQWRFDIVGDGLLASEVVKLADQLDNVHYHGLISHIGGLETFYSKADVLVVPSLFDGWAAVVNEGISKACAIIASDTVYAAKSLVEDYSNGIIFNRDEELINALTFYIRNKNALKNHQQHSLSIFKEWNHVNAALSFYAHINNKENGNFKLLKLL